MDIHSEVDYVCIEFPNLLNLLNIIIQIPVFANIIWFNIQINLFGLTSKYTSFYTGGASFSYFRPSISLRLELTMLGAPSTVANNFTFSGGVLSILTGDESTSMLLTPSEFIQATTML